MLIFPFVIINVLILYLGEKKFNKAINPITVYSVTFTISFTLYELKLLQYDELSIFTFIVIVLAELLFVVGCIWGRKTRYFNVPKNRNKRNSIYDDNKLKRNLTIWIIVLSLLSSISIGTGFLLLLKDYEFSIMRILTSGDTIYAAHVTGTRKYLYIPYLSCFAMNALALSGIYLKKYGFRWFIIVPILLECAVTLMTGSRYVVVLSSIVFLTAIVITNNNIKKTKVAISIKNIKRKLVSLGLIFVLLYVFNNVTSSRSRWISKNQYVNPFLANLMDHFGSGVYKIYTYLASPVGVLNAFLRDPYFEPGQTTFRGVFRILKKFNLVEEAQNVGRNYYIPIESNTGTYIKNMIADFSILAPLMILIWGIICGKLYYNAEKNQSISLLSTYSVLMSIISYCFFTWYFSETSTWISLFAAIIVGKIIEKRSVIDEKSIDFMQ